jgi:hypothetical protein
MKRLPGLQFESLKLDIACRSLKEQQKPAQSKEILRGLDDAGVEADGAYCEQSSHAS